MARNLNNTLCSLKVRITKVNIHCNLCSLSSYSNGPISSNSPAKLEAPGPPCSQRIHGVVSTGFSFTGKYQKKVLELYLSSTVRKPEWLVTLRKRAGLTVDRFLASSVLFWWMYGVRRRAGVNAVAVAKLEYSQRNKC